MNLTFTARIVDKQIVCEITSDVNVTQPVFCFSLLAPMAVVKGGTLLHSDGGYGEVSLPDLIANQPHQVTVTYAVAGYWAKNRAWLPLGAYLRHQGGATDLPELRSGVIAGSEQVAAPVKGLRLVPPPNQWCPDGNSIAVSGFQFDHDALGSVEALVRRSDLPAFRSEGGISITVNDQADLPRDAYELAISGDVVEIKAGSRGGVFYAGITLLTLLKNHDGDLPCGRITDAPAYGWRGQHLDCARHFYQPRTILKLLDLMALLKLNRFHWHFADDEAFRLELNTLPELAVQTAMRGEGQLMPGLFGGGQRSGGAYSQADAKEIIAHAKALNIEVMPEIEVTAHALAITRVYPEMRDPDDIGGEVSVQGYPKNAVNPAMPKTWEVLHAMIDEVAGLFPFEVLHLGCDELADKTWDGSPAIRQMKERNQLPDCKDVQGWMMDKLAKRAANSGKRTAAWEEAAQGNNGGVGNNALLFSWTGQAPGIKAAREGHDVIMIPAQNMYFDAAHSPDENDWGATWAGTLPLEKTIDWSPVPAEAPDIAPRIKGVQGAFWSEFTTKDHQLWPMLLPRMLGLSCKAWDARDQADAAWIVAIAHAYRPLLSGFKP